MLFGRSGLGKTSLLQAGLFPLLRSNDSLPIRIRVRYGEHWPDPVSQIGLAVPTIILYEISIWAARMVEKKREADRLAREKAETTAKAKPAAAPDASAAE